MLKPPKAPYVNPNTVMNQNPSQFLEGRRKKHIKIVFFQEAQSCNTVLKEVKLPLVFLPKL